MLFHDLTCKQNDGFKSGERKDANSTLSSKKDKRKEALGLHFSPFPFYFLEKGGIQTMITTKKFANQRSQNDSLFYKGARLQSPRAHRTLLLVGSLRLQYLHQRP